MKHSFQYIIQYLFAHYSKATIAFACIILTVCNTCHSSALDEIGINALKKQFIELDGTGTKIAVISRSMTYKDGSPLNDYKPFYEHNCLRNANLNFYDPNAISENPSPHSTAICSILLGSDPNAYIPEIGKFEYYGIIPNAKADIYEFWYFLTNYIYTNKVPDADIITTSCGNQFQDWWTRGFESLVSNHGKVIVAGIGNGTKYSDPLLYPAAGANIIGVGVVDSVVSENWQLRKDNFTLPHSNHSSIGPTQEKTCKPDIVAPGNFLVADVNIPNSYNLAGDFSSYATPAVAAAAGLLIQKAKEDSAYELALSQQAGNCVIKAVLLNSATKLPFWHKGLLSKQDDHQSPLDYSQGAGMLNAQEAYKTFIAGPYLPGNVNSTGWDLNFLDMNNQEKSYDFTIENPGNNFITATLSWNFYYDNQYPFNRLTQYDTNLRLELWRVDNNAPEKNIMIDYCDSTVDNLEHIYFHADKNHNNYKIVVKFSSDYQIIKNICQPFALAWGLAKPIDKNNILFYDLNCDGIVTEEDAITLTQNWLEHQLHPEKNLLGDINNDGKINMPDVKMLIKHKNQTADWIKK